MLHHLEPGRAQEAVKLVANLDSFAKGVDLKVRLPNFVSH
jgi:hypothetical protein